MLTHINNGYKFRPGDRVYWLEAGGRSLVGPLFIAAQSNSKKYTLCEENRTSYGNGRELKENELDHAD
jgi:hypothetical protein